MIKLQLLPDRIEGHWDPERLTQVMTNLINNAVQHVLFDVTEILRNEGYAVTTATNGLEALTLLRSGVRPKVILTDVIMPEMDGERLCAACHEDPALSNIPVVYLPEMQEPLQGRNGVVLPVSCRNRCSPTSSYERSGGRGIESPET